MGMAGALVESLDMMEGTLGVQYGRWRRNGEPPPERSGGGGAFAPHTCNRRWLARPVDRLALPAWPWMAAVSGIGSSTELHREKFSLGSRDFRVTCAGTTPPTAEPRVARTERTGFRE